VSEPIEPRHPEHTVLFPAFVWLLMRAGGEVTIKQSDIESMRWAEVQMLEGKDQVTYRLIPPKDEVWVAFRKGDA